MIKRVLLLVLTVLFNRTVNAQNTNSNEKPLIHQQIWIDFYPHYYVNEKLEYYGDFGYRTIVNDQITTRVYTRPSAKYHLNKKWELHGGLGLFYLFNKHENDRLEISPWQGIQFNWPKARRISFKHLIKIEERFSLKTKSWSSSFDFRFRYKLSGRLKLFKKLAATKNWYVPFYAEIFYPINNEIDEIFRNKGRAGLGVGYNFSEIWRLSVLLNWQSSRTGISEELIVSDYAYQLKIMKRWKSK